MEEFEYTFEALDTPIFNGDTVQSKTQIKQNRRKISAYERLLDYFDEHSGLRCTLMVIGIAILCGIAAFIGIVESWLFRTADLPWVTEAFLGGATVIALSFISYLATKIFVHWL